ncbi:MAG TPA: methyltransferase domain-containing protein [Myxococcota bacterium]|jgi:protein-L-isoaspartate(D-aspartate) O-methyltransferase
MPAADAAELRAAFAASLRERAPGIDARILAAFAAVPREEFLGRGPWLTLPDAAGYRSTPDADLRHVYQDVAIALDPARMLNNGSPSFLARVIDALAVREGERVAHIGCSTGYYSAILAEIVGTGGRVVAVELAPDLVERARKQLARWKQVEVRHADGVTQPTEPADVIFVQAGVTHPQPRWLEQLAPGGRLALALTAILPPSRIRRIVRDHAGWLLVVTRTPRGLRAGFLEVIGVQALLGGRDGAIQARLREAFARERGARPPVASLRTDAHDADASCWLHEASFCLSRREIA